MNLKLFERKLVNSEYIDRILAYVNVPCDHPNFYKRVFTGISKEKKRTQASEGDNLKRVCTEEYDDLSRRLDLTGIQESCSVRNVLRTRRLANLLISDKGEIHIGLIPHVISHLKENLYSLGPERQHDTRRQEHILKVLTLLKENKELVILLRRIGRPHSQLHSEQIIRETLQLPTNTSITDAHARRAALSAWMVFLRQNVGSCFATAPAIIIHDEQPDLFLTDINELLSTGSLKRTYAGIEHSVPLSISWGSGDLRKPILLSYDLESDSGAWNSPGILLGLESIGYLQKEMATKEKIAIVKELILDAFPEWSGKNPLILTSTEDIFKHIVMKKLDITSQDLEAYSQRPKDMIFSNLLLQPSMKGSNMGGKGEQCGTFYFQMEKVSSSFKALSDNALLKSWEFTIASFSETKSQFARWNLYSCLGLRPEDPQGIGQFLYEFIKKKLDVWNQKVRDLQIEYEQTYAFIKQLESRMRHVSSEKDAHWAQAEYQSKINEFYTFEEVRNKAHARAQLYSNLFDILITTYDRLFPQYFQEVYDADLHEVSVGPFDDSPAGFRLIYKHGRGNTAQWTKIKTPEEFTDALSKFFVATESEISSLEGLEGVQTEISEIITGIVHHVKTQDFLESAFHRMAAAHQVPAIANPLENLDKITIKPWAYVSGGTMGSLVSAYYRREQKPTEVSRWVENPMELLVFFIDTLKHIPYNVMEGYLKNPNKSMLMHSPTHAFLMKPGVMPFKDSWQNEAYTYTWIRDFYVRPRSAFVDSLNLDDSMIEYLIEKISNSVPENYRHYFRKVFSNIHGTMNSVVFRDFVVDTIERERGLQYKGNPVVPSEIIDSLLYSLLPLFPGHQLEPKVRSILEEIPLSQEVKDNLNYAIEHSQSQFSVRNILSSQDLHDICMAFLCLAFGKTTLSTDFHLNIRKAAQELQLAMPSPFMFSDTNWVKDLFAFIVSPGTGVLELWRVDPIGKNGYPMTSWREWLNGTRKDALWGIYSRPHEYFSAKQMAFSNKHPPSHRL